VGSGFVEYVVLGFPGSSHVEDIAPALRDATTSGHVRILDLVFIVKDADGNVEAVEFDDRDTFAAFSQIDGEVGDLISTEDIAYVGEGLERDSSAALIVWEDVWAAALSEALARANGVLLEGGFIPGDVLEATETDVTIAR
jgi:hypothetical protein